MGERAYRAWIVAVAAFVAARAAPHMWRPAWQDEQETMRLATCGLGELVDTLRERDAILLPYYLVARLWLGPFESVVWLRVLSLAATLAAVVAVAVVGRRLSGRVGAGVAVAVMALHPLVPRYAAEARPYALAMLAVVLVAAAPRGRAVAASAAALLHLFAALPALAILAGQRRWRPLAVAAAVTVPLAVVGYAQRGQVDWIGDVTPAGTLSPVLPADWLTGSSPIIALAAVVGLAVSRRPWVAAWALAPAALLYAVSLAHPMIVPRYLLFSVPAVALLASSLTRPASSALARRTRAATSGKSGAPTLRV